MSSVSALSIRSIGEAFANTVLGHVAAAVDAGNLAGVKTAAAVQYCIGGLTYATGAAVAAGMVVTHDSFGEPVRVAKPAYIQPADTVVYYSICINAAGTVAVVQGSYAGQVILDQRDLSRTMIGDGEIPVTPAGYIALAIVRVETITSTFTPGTTELDADGVSSSVFGINSIPWDFWFPWHSKRVMVGNLKVRVGNNLVVYGG